MKKIYLDNAATTKVDKKVIEAMLPFFDKKYGNASSLHSFGREAKEALEKARAVIKKALNAESYRIIFTSSGTESNNLAIKGIAFANSKKGNHIITTKIEHECVLNACRWLEEKGFKVTYLDVDKEGFVNPEELAKAIRKETILVSIIHGNNEIGTIQNLRELGRICRGKKVYFHTDACQSFTKVPIDLKKGNVDLITINAHKINGPKGVGALVIRDGIDIEPLLHGGGQENGLRSSTENIAGIVGFAKAVEISSNKDSVKIEKIRNYLIRKVLKIKDVKLNGPNNNRLCNNANFSFKNIEGESIVLYLDKKGIAVSTGSACSSKSLEPSHVLIAIGLKPEEAHGGIRISLSKETTKKEIDYTVKVLKEAVQFLRALSPFA